MNKKIKDAQARVRSAFTAMESAGDAIANADAEANLDELRSAFDEARDEHTAAVADLARLEEIEEARKALPVEPAPDTRSGLADVSVGKEPLTYERHSKHSIFRDMRNARAGDRSAAERLARHSQEMLVEMPAEQRAINSTDGTGGEFIPPIWLQDQWINLPRAARPVADSLRSVPLPPNTDTINLPKVATGAATAVQTDGGSVQSTDITTTSVTGAVQTIAGQQDVSQQLVDLSAPGIDQVIFDDITRDYDTKLDVAVINGSVSNAKGLLQVSGTNGVTYTDASPTVPELYPKLANVIGLINNTRFLPPQVLAMTPLRWAWILASLDSSNRPLVVPVGQPGFNAAAVQDRVAAENVVGTIMGLPVVVDASIPQTLGGGTEDAILAYRADDVYLYESAPKLRVFEEVLSGTLQVRFQVYGYYAIIAGRLPKAIGKVTGTGLAAPTF